MPHPLNAIQTERRESPCKCLHLRYPAILAVCVADSSLAAKKKATRGHACRSLFRWKLRSRPASGIVGNYISAGDFIGLPILCSCRIGVAGSAIGEGSTASVGYRIDILQAGWGHIYGNLRQL